MTEPKLEVVRKHAGLVLGYGERRVLIPWPNPPAETLRDAIMQLLEEARRG
jgi:hypothetical protein